MVVTLHAPFTDMNPASPFEPMRGAVLRKLLEVVEFGEYIGARVLTVHPGSVHSPALVAQSSGVAVSAMKEMVKAAEGRISISVENQTGSRSKYHYPLASTEESLREILGQVDGLRFTLDTGHAHANGQDPLSLAKLERQKLVEVHLSDNSGKSDDHLVPGKGTASLQPLLDFLSGTDVLLCLELDPHRYRTDEVMNAVASLRERLRKGATPAPP
jgi:sugar phosphate isomerase/epimerase